MKNTRLISNPIIYFNNLCYFTKCQRLSNPHRQLPHNDMCTRTTNVPNFKHDWRLFFIAFCSQNPCLHMVVLVKITSTFVTFSLELANLYANDCHAHKNSMIHKGLCSKSQCILEFKQFNPTQNTICGQNHELYHHV